MCLRTKQLQEGVIGSGPNTHQCHSEFAHRHKFEFEFYMIFKYFVWKSPLVFFPFQPCCASWHFFSQPPPRSNHEKPTSPLCSLLSHFHSTQKILVQPFSSLSHLCSLSSFPFSLALLSSPELPQPREPVATLEVGEEGAILPPHHHHLSHHHHHL